MLNQMVCCVCGSVKREKPARVEGRKAKKFKGTKKQWSSEHGHVACSPACKEWLHEHSGNTCPFHGH